MKELKDILSDFGAVGTIGIGLVLIALIPLLGLSSFKIEELPNLSPYQMIGIAFLGSGLILLISRIVQRNKESTINDADAQLLREYIIPPLNREAILNADEANEDLRAQFSGVNAARITLQKNKNRLSSYSLRETVDVVTILLNDIHTYSPWNDVDRAPDRNEVWRHQKEFDEWCTERVRDRKPVPPYINRTSYGPMLSLLQTKLYPIRVIKAKLEIMSSMQKS